MSPLARRMALAMALVLCIGGCRAGSIILGGDDFPDHGKYDPDVFEETNQFLRAWKFIDIALRMLIEDSSLRDKTGTVAIIGSSDSDSRTETNPGTCYHWICELRGHDCIFVDGADNIASYLTAIVNRDVAPSVLVIGGDHYLEDYAILDENESQVLFDHLDKIAWFVDHGGSLMSHTHDYRWVKDAIGLNVVDECDSVNATITEDGRALFSGVDNTDIDRGGDDNNALCHNTFNFEGSDLDQSVFFPLVLDSEGRWMGMIARGSLYGADSVRLNCSSESRHAGEWSVFLEGSFGVTFEVPAGTPGNALELMLQDELNEDEDFIDKMCTATHAGNFMAACPRGSGLADMQVCFYPFDESLEVECSDFEDFNINGIGCPVPPCEECTGDEEPEAICDQLGHFYPTRCVFNRVACEVPAEPLFEAPCPTPTVTRAPSPTPTFAPTARPTSNPTAAPTPIPTRSPTPIPTFSPTPIPTSSPTPIPTSSPTPIPTAGPSPSPTSVPTPSPTAGPSPSPTNQPTSAPTGSPTPSPTSVPTPQPTSSPTGIPTASPSPSPTGVPSPAPTGSPTSMPTPAPTPVETAPPQESAGIADTSVGTSGGLLQQILSINGIIYILISVGACCCFFCCFFIWGARRKRRRRRVYIVNSGHVVEEEYDLEAGQPPPGLMSDPGRQGVSGGGAGAMGGAEPSASASAGIPPPAIAAAAAAAGAALQSSLSRPQAVPAPLPPPTRKASMRRTTLRRTMKKERGAALAAAAAQPSSRPSLNVNMGNVNPSPLLNDKKAKVGSETPPGVQNKKRPIPPPSRPKGPKPPSNTPFSVPQYDSSDSEGESPPPPSAARPKPPAAAIVPAIPPPKRNPSMRRSRKSSRAGIASRKSSRAGVPSRKASRAGLPPRKSSRTQIMSGGKPDPPSPFLPSMPESPASAAGRPRTPASDAEAAVTTPLKPTPPRRVKSPGLAERMAFFENQSRR